MKLYKLTNSRGQTFNNTQWGENITHYGTGEGPLCGPGWIHAYTDPYLAVLLNPIHAEFYNPQLWEAKGEIIKEDRGLKVGCKALTTIRQVPLPKLTFVQKVAFGIFCTKEAVYEDKKWNTWADGWLENKDRTYKSAEAVYTPAFIAYTIAYTTADAAAYATDAAIAATTAINDNDAAAIYAAAATAYAVAAAVNAAAHAAANAATASILNFPKLIQKALTIS